METKSAVTLLAALAQETRLAIFRLLVIQGAAGMNAGKIGETLAIAPATLSFHLKELARANLIEARQDGRFIHYTVCFPTMNALLGFLAEDCCGGQDCGLGLPAKTCATNCP